MPPRPARASASIWRIFPISGVHSDGPETAAGFAYPPAVEATSVSLTFQSRAATAWSWVLESVSILRLPLRYDPVTCDRSGLAAAQTAVAAPFSGEAMKGHIRAPTIR